MSLRKFVFVIKDLLWWRILSWYGNLLLSGRYGCTTWLLLVLILQVYSQVNSQF